MGLSAPKTRRKVGLDPNNNNWARNTDSFGHKMLRAHGWEPGQYLGAKDAPHAQWHTAANASHIRVVLKEDNLGIGANRNHGDQCTGLNDFQDILGRLNGKADATVETERKVREDVMVSLYVERKFGSMRFVKGGWLVGDKLQETAEVTEQTPESEDSEASSSVTQPPEQPGGEAKKAKKRKLEDEASAQDDSGKKKSKKRKAEESSGAETEKEKRRRERKERKLKKKEEDTVADADDGPDDAKAGNGETGDSETSITRAAKKRSKKEKKLKEKKSKADDSSETEEKPKNKKKRRKADDEPVSEEVAELASAASLSKDASSSSTPADSGRSTPIRHLSRKRFIAQKRMAFSDPTALNQIFMIKSET